MAKYSPSPPILSSICEGRLTLTSGVPVLISDVIGAGTLYWTPYRGNRVALYDGTKWVLHTFSELSLSLSVTAGTNYDVFLYNNGGTLTLELTAWATSTAGTDDRATGLVLQDGVLVRSGAPSRRYLGTLRASGTNTCECSFTWDNGPRKMFLYNHYNQSPMFVRAMDNVNPNGYTYSTPAHRRCQDADRARVEFVLGQPQQVRFDGKHRSSSTTLSYRIAGIGINSITGPAPGAFFYASSSSDQSMAIEHAQVLTSGYHFAHLLEYGDSAGTNTWRFPRSVQASFLS